MSMLIKTPVVAHNFARARAQLRRDDTLRALESMLAGLQQFDPQKLPGKARFEVEVLIIECVQELNRQPAIRDLFSLLTQGKAASVPYTPGQERKLLGVVGLVHKALAEKMAAEERGAEEELQKRRESLEQKGRDFLVSGDSPRGKATLRVLTEEFGHEPGVLLDTGELLLEHKLLFEAAETLEQCMELFPKEGKAYALCAQIYLDLREFAKAETVYTRAIKQFGKHPRTLLSLAKLYMAWNKKEEAFTAAAEALKKDPGLAEAKEIVDKYA